MKIFVIDVLNFNYLYSEKLRLEEKQRCKRRQREAAAEAAAAGTSPAPAPEQPAWFSRHQAPTDSTTHFYTGDYWPCKERQDWTRCPDIY